MATLSINHSFSINRSIRDLKGRSRNRPRNLSVFSCQSHESTNIEEQKKEKKQRWSLLEAITGLEKIGKKLKEEMSPGKKGGDWKDVMLMSLSFAVYVYISQRIVCVYCAWTSLSKHSW